MSQEVVTNKPSKNFKPLKKFFEILGDAVFILLLLTMVVLAFFLIRSKVSNRAPSIGGYSMYVVMSGSMNPAFDTGSLVMEKQVDKSILKSGDIITYVPANSQNVSVTHRIVKVNKGDKLSFITKGDANNVNDAETIYPENVLGKVVFSIPYIGYLMYYVRTKLGTMLLIIVPGALIMLYEIRNLFCAFKEDLKEKIAKNEIQNK